MNIRDSGARFFTTFQVVNGSGFSGTLHKIAEAHSFGYPFQVLRVRPRALVKAGDVFKTAAGRAYCCGEHFDRAEEKNFKVFEVDRTGTWTRETFTVDAVTGVKKKSGATTLDTIYYQLVPEAPEFDQIRVPVPKYRILTPAAIQAGDMIDALLVLNSTPLLGVYTGEVR